MKIDNIVDLLEEIYTPAQIVEMLQDIDKYDIEKYALDHDVCPRLNCYGELLRYEYKEYRGEHFGFPAYEPMVASKCEKCGEIFD